MSYNKENTNCIKKEANNLNKLNNLFFNKPFVFNIDQITNILDKAKEVYLKEDSIEYVDLEKLFLKNSFISSSKENNTLKRL